MISTMYFEPGSPEDILVTRAGSHAVHPDVISPDARFQDGVTDLDVARLMAEIERGMPISQTANGRWFAPQGSRLGSAVSSIVREAVRTGLLIHHVSGVLIPAKVHLAVGEGQAWITRCSEPGEGMGPKRVRLVREAIMVDCLACLDQL